MFEDLEVPIGHLMASNAITMASVRENDLEQFVRDYSQLAFRIAYSVLRNQQDAEDATQETFLRVLRWRRKLEDIQDPKAWLARIAWRVALERKRKPSHISLDELDGIARKLRSHSTQSDEIVLGSEMNVLMEKLIGMLPPKLRDPLTLSTVDDISIAEIAKIIGANEAAVRSRVFRARQILREKLAGVLEAKHEH